MTLVSYQHDFIYLRTLKTGSTATELALTPYCVPDGVEVDPFNLWPVFSPEGIVSRRRRATQGWDGIVEKLLWNDISKQLNRRYWVAHQSARRVRFNLGRGLFERLTKVTTLRNPFARTVSLFYWRRRNQTRLFRDPERLITSFREFVMGPKLNDDREIVYIGKQFTPDVILRQESLEADIRAFLSERGADMSRFKLTREKTTASSDATVRPSMRDLYNEECADIVRTRLNWMFQHGGYPLELPA